MIAKRRTRQIRVGDVRIGGGAPISIQSMAKTDTRNVPATIKQIKQLEGLGCDIIRVAVLDAAAARAISQIKKGIKIPLVADIHFHYNLALEAMKSGADKIRLNPGNIKDRKDIEEVVKLAKKRKVPIRIGVNSGSVPHIPMTKAAIDYVKIFEQLDFHDIIISLKASGVPTTINAYREMAKLCDYPFHLGVTAAGPSECGIIKSSIGIGALLAEGLGDTIRVSLTGSPEDEVRIGKEILNSLGLKRGGLDIISCPTCGRCEVDLIRVVKEFENRVICRGAQLCAPTNRPTKVAIMGCVVNGPGEAQDADIGIAAGKGCGMLFRKGKIVKKINEKDFVKTLLRELKINTDANGLKERMQTDKSV